MHEGLELRELSGHADIRAIVLTGAGGMRGVPSDAREAERSAAALAPRARIAKR
jgi:hypothetical protein